LTPIRWRLVGRTELDAIATGLRASLQAWAKAWLLEPELHVEIEDAATAHCSLAPLLCLREDGKDGARGVLHAAAPPLALLQAAWRLTGAPSSPVHIDAHDLSARMVEYALRDLLVRIGQLPAGSHRNDALFAHDAPLNSGGRGSGAVLARIRLAQEELALSLSAGMLERWRAPIGKRDQRKTRTLSTRLEALGRQRMRVVLVAGEAQLKFSELAHLACGDVLVLETRAEQALTLENASGQTLGHGYLGLHAGRAALQLCA
jgi:hypothetical protein